MNRLPKVTEPAIYRIRIADRVSNGWSDFMEELEQSFDQNDGMTITTLRGVVADQAALFGMLCRIRDRGLILISVEYLPEFNKGTIK